MTLREIAEAVRREEISLQQAYDELERRKRLGSQLGPDEPPPD